MLRDNDYSASSGRCGALRVHVVLRRGAWLSIQGDGLVKDDIVVELIWGEPSLDAAEADLRLAHDQFNASRVRLRVAQEIMRKAREISWRKAGRVWE